MQQRPPSHQLDRGPISQPVPCYQRNGVIVGSAASCGSKRLPQNLLDEDSNKIRNERINAPLDEWMLEPLEPYDFCVRWLPPRYNLKWGDHHAREKSCEILSSITGHKESTWNSYLSGSDKVSLGTKRLLRLVDLFWQTKGLIPLPLSSLKF